MEATARQLEDRLVRLAPGQHAGGLWVDPIYWRLGRDGALPDLWMRAELPPRLLDAASSARRLGHGLLVWEGWRSPALQRNLFDAYRSELAQFSGLTGDALAKLVAQFVTDPERSSAPPAHATGGAVDLTLCDPTTGAPRDMGGEFDELTPRSHPTHYDDGRSAQERAFAALRRTLERVMASVGFVQLPTEWWHFEYGTALWSEHARLPTMFSRARGPERVSS